MQMLAGRVLVADLLDVLDSPREPGAIGAVLIEIAFRGDRHRIVAARLQRVGFLAAVGIERPERCLVLGKPKVNLQLAHSARLARSMFAFSTKKETATTQGFAAHDSTPLMDAHRVA